MLPGGRRATRCPPVRRRGRSCPRCRPSARKPHISRPKTLSGRWPAGPSSSAAGLVPVAMAALAPRILRRRPFGSVAFLASIRIRLVPSPLSSSIAVFVLGLISAELVVYFSAIHGIECAAPLRHLLQRRSSVCGDGLGQRHTSGGGGRGFSSL